jgi:hypothetical protein
MPQNRSEVVACNAQQATNHGIADGFCELEINPREVVNGFVLGKPRDTRTLSPLIARLQAEPDLRRKVGEAVRKTILEWD